MKIKSVVMIVKHNIIKNEDKKIKKKNCIIVKYVIKIFV
jgi:hypothetical protein